MRQLIFRVRAKPGWNKKHPLGAYIIAYCYWLTTHSKFDFHHYEKDGVYHIEKFDEAERSYYGPGNDFRKNQTR